MPYWPNLAGTQPWMGVNFNLLHTRRLMQSDDAVQVYAAELRMSLYGVVSLLLSYFHIRKLLWEGDKAAIRYLMAHDMPYLELLRQFLRESDPHRKFVTYERIAAATLAPISTLWSGEPTVLWNDTGPASWEMLEQSLAFWEALFQSDDKCPPTNRPTPKITPTGTASVFHSFPPSPAGSPIH
jgi:hypothetical protein